VRVNGSDVTYLVVGGALVVGALFLAVFRKENAKVIHGYYHGRPAGNWGPTWLRWQFRPTERQATIVGLMLAATMASLGVLFLVKGLP
jgi:hypothetical protein